MPEPRTQPAPASEKWNPCGSRKETWIQTRVPGAGWLCRMHLDVRCPERFVSDEYPAVVSPPESEAASHLHIREEETGALWVSWRDQGELRPLTPFLTAPEGTRFIRFPHESRLLYQDRMMGERPVIEAYGSHLVVLEPTLFSGYLQLIATWVLLQQYPAVRLHCAVLSIDDTAIVLIGPSGRGKSTLAWALTQRGATLYSDESAFFAMDTFHLVPGPKSLHLRPGGLALLDAPPEAASPFETRPGDPKFAVGLPRAGRACPQERVLLIFLDAIGDVPCLLPIPGEAALLALLRGMAYGPSAVGARLEAAADLLERFPSLSLTLGGPDETAVLLAATVRGAL